MTNKQFLSRVLKPIIFILMLLPLFWLAWNWQLFLNGLPNVLTANPIEYTNRYLGGWALKYILLTLIISPLADISGWRKPILFRRMIGLFAFTFSIFHLSSYIALDHYFNWMEIGEDIVKRNFITIGMLSIGCLLPLALTSTNKMITRLGSKNWKKLHSLIYPVSILTVLHFTMMRKGDQLEPKIYWTVLALLLGYRIYKYFRYIRKRPNPKIRP